MVLRFSTGKVILIGRTCYEMAMRFAMFFGVEEWAKRNNKKMKYMLCLDRVTRKDGIRMSTLIGIYVNRNFFFLGTPSEMI